MSMPAPNWYPDPQDAALLRWWSGESWTEHTSVREPATVVAAPAIPTAHPFADAPPYAPGMRFADEIPAERPAKSRARDREFRIHNFKGWLGAMLGLGGLVINVVGLVSVAAVILSIMGIRRAAELQREGHRPIGRGGSIAGLVLGVVGFVVWGGAFFTSLVRIFVHY